MLTLAHAMAAGASHINHADMLRSGARPRCCRIGSWRPLRWARSWVPSPSAMSASSMPYWLRCCAGTGSWGPGRNPTNSSWIESTTCEVCGKAKGGVGYGYTKRFGYHPLLATPADTGEVPPQPRRGHRHVSGRDHFSIRHRDDRGGWPSSPTRAPRARSARGQWMDAVSLLVPTRSSWCGHAPPKGSHLAVDRQVWLVASGCRGRLGEGAHSGKGECTARGSRWRQSAIGLRRRPLDERRGR